MSRLFLFAAFCLSLSSHAMDDQRNDQLIFQGDKLWIKTTDGKFTYVAGFGWETGKPQDVKQAELDYPEETRDALATLLKDVASDTKASQQWKRRAYLFNASEKARLAHGETALTSSCASCHTGKDLMEITPLADNLPFWKELLSSEDPTIRRKARTQLEPLYRALADRKSMPREDVASHDAFHSSDEGSDLVAFLEKHHFAGMQEGPKVTQLLSDRTVDIYRGIVPKVESEELQKLLTSQGTFFYDQQLMPPAYVDDRDKITGFLYTSDGIAQERTMVIDGSGFRFPFGTTAGMHSTRYGKHFNFLHLPSHNGARLPVAIQNGGARWIFPEGTLMGETLYIPSKQKGSIAFEMRVSWKENGQWHYETFRPFPTSEHLVQAIDELLETKFKDDKQLIALKAHLEDPSTLVPDSLSEAAGAFGGVLPVLKAGKDVLPPISLDAVMALMQRPFKSAKGAIWREDPSRNLVSYAPTGSTVEHITPAGFKGHFFANENQSCVTCHQEARRQLASFFGTRAADIQLLSYGSLWGEDQKFSFFPLVTGDNATPRAMAINPRLLSAGIVQHYNSTSHPAWAYRQTSRH